MSFLSLVVNGIEYVSSKISLIRIHVDVVIIQGVYVGYAPSNIVAKKKYLYVVHIDSILYSIKIYTV